MVKKMVAFATAACMMFSTSVLAVNSGNAKSFKDTLGIAQEKEWGGKNVESRPLVILMNFQDYKYTDLETKESWTINERPGKDFTPELYEEMFFGDNTYTAADGNEYITINKYMLSESGGSYSFKGEAHGWYEAKNGYQFYGANNDSWGTDQQSAAVLVQEALVAAANDPNVDLSKFDVMDKNDIDGDGNYFEPDGIIDSVIVIHAGRGEEWDNALGEDAIWPYKHSFTKFGEYKPYEFVDLEGKSWGADDYTVFEQDLPVDLLIHEYGHIMGLPDLYGNEPPVEYWSIMGGSYTGPIYGSMPNSFGAYCRSFLQDDFKNRGIDMNWENKLILKLDEVTEKGIDVVLDQASIKGENYNTVKIELPQREYEIVKPVEGIKVYFSGNEDNSKNSMSTKVDLSKVKNATLKFKTWYDIDPGFDFASIQAREVGSEEWTALKGNITTEYVDQWVKDNEPADEIKANRNPGHGITNDSGNEWVDAEFDLSSFIGKNIELRINFWADSNTPEQGIYIDDIKIVSGETVLLQDNAEEDSRFELNGFTVSDGKEYANHYYLLEWRNGDNGLVDQGLNYGYRKIEYDPGLVIWYINEKWVDENGRPDQYTKGHPGEAFASIIDADQNAVIYKYDDGRNGTDGPKFQMHDAAFSLEEHSQFYYRSDDYAYIISDKNVSMTPSFMDNRDYTNPSKNNLGVNLEDYGLSIFVLDENTNKSSAKIHIAKKKDGKLANQSLSEQYIKSVDVIGDQITVKSTSEVNSMVVQYKLENQNVFHSVKMEKKGDKFLGKLDFVNNGECGKYQINFIQIKDEAGNTKGIYNSALNNGFGMNLSSGDFASLLGFNDLSVQKGEKNYTIKLDGFNRSHSTEKITVVVRKNMEDSSKQYALTRNYNVKAFGELKDELKVSNENVKSITVFVYDKDMNLLESITK